MGKLGTPGGLFCDPLPAQAFPRKVITRGVANGYHGNAGSEEIGAGDGLLSLSRRSRATPQDGPEEAGFEPQERQRPQGQTQRPRAELGVGGTSSVGGEASGWQKLGQDFPRVSVGPQCSQRTLGFTLGLFWGLFPHIPWQQLL